MHIPFTIRIIKYLSVPVLQLAIQIFGPAHAQPAINFRPESFSLGAGGSTKMVDPVRDRIERVFHPKFPTEYIARPEKIRQDLETFRRFHENMLK